MPLAASVPTAATPLYPLSDGTPGKFGKGIYHPAELACMVRDGM